MKFKLSLILCSFSLLLANTEPVPYIDFGVEGHLYNIEEEDFHLKLLKGIKESGFLEKDFTEEIKDEVKKISNFKSELPLCLNDNKREELDYNITAEDMYNPMGRLIHKSGEKVDAVVKVGSEFSIFFIDGRNEENLKNQISKIKSEYVNSFFLVNNYDTIKLSSKILNRDFFPSTKAQEERFNIRCYPSKVDFQGNKRIITELSYDKFSN